MTRYSGVARCGRRPPVDPGTLEALRRIDERLRGRPAYSPGLLVGDVMILLASAGLRDVEVRDHAAATYAAEILLEALGVDVIDDGDGDRR
jgi:hypothetical protein